jgi:hypothetical protein
MKRILFHNPSALILNALLILFTFIGCKKQTTEVNTLQEEIATAKPPASPPQISLRMTVRDAVGDKITSDGGGDYIDGSQNVAVYFSSSGNLQFTATANSRHNVLRHLNYDFSDPVLSSVARGSEQGGFISTTPSAVSPAPYVLQNIPEGTTVCIVLSCGLSTFTDGGVNFHRGAEDTPTTPTAYMYVTRVSPTQWTMTPVPPLSGGCSAISNIAALRNSTTLYGYYNMPFSFTLTKL